MNLTTTTSRPIKNNNVVVTSAQQQSLTPLLCYACHTTLTSRGTRGGIAAAAAAATGQFATQVLPLPMWVHDHIDDNHHGVAFRTTKLTEKEMKSEIGEFLLPDE